MSKSIQIIYGPGTFGNLLRWVLDRFSPDTKLGDSPWDKDNRVHENYSALWNPKFSNAHQLPYKPGVDYDKSKDPSLGVQFYSVDPSADKIIINHEGNFLFQERCHFWRSPGRDTPEGQYKYFISLADQSFVEKTFGTNSKSSKYVAKELFKIQFHDWKNNKWWNAMTEYSKNETHYQFPITALWNLNQFVYELENISKKYSLGLSIDKDILSRIVGKIDRTYPVCTRTRAIDVLKAVQKNENIDCADFDIVEQAWLEVVLEKEHDSVLFPYGTGWYENSKQIREFLDTYPNYLKHMNPRLPWYNNLKNPFHLTGKINE
jgi:hypothetical protein